MPHCSALPRQPAHHDWELKAKFGEGSLALAIRGIWCLPTKLIAGKSNKVETSAPVLLQQTADHQV